MHQRCDCGGLASGVFHRIFELLDTNRHVSTICWQYFNMFFVQNFDFDHFYPRLQGKVSFEAFLEGSRVFMHGSQLERYKLAFRFFDFQDKSMVTKEDLKRGFQMFHLLYNGQDGQREEMSGLFVDLILRKIGERHFQAANIQQDHEPSELGSLGSLELSGAPRTQQGLVTSTGGREGLSFEVFAENIDLHPYSQMFFEFQSFHSSTDR